MATLTVIKRTTRSGDGLTARLRQRAQTILAGTYTYMDSPTFKDRNVERDLFDNAVEPELPPMRWYQPTIADDSNNATTPRLMKTQEERLMFLRFNFAKRRLAQLQAKAAKAGINRELADALVLWNDRAQHYREYLVRTNLALVLAMAKRSRVNQVDFAEVVSEGNMALLRAVDKFNVDRGFKFSTYACRAILKSFSRSAQKVSRYYTRFPVEFEPDMEKSDWQDRRRDQVEDECLDELKTIVDRNLADLSGVEQTVIRRRFNWKQEDQTPLTLEEVGKIIGVTKERVRQIQNKALLKIRTVMESGVLRTRTETPDKASDEAAQG
jgi:RNA polymerase primary sigma factor